MKYIAAYLLAQLGGIADPTAEEVTAILETVGVSVNQTQLSAVIGKLKGQDTAALIQKGAANLVGGGGGGGAAAAAPAAAGPAEAAPAKEEKKEEETVVELAGGFEDLFG
jgi:large subunit ribosomal protein LP2